MLQKSVSSFVLKLNEITMTLHWLKNKAEDAVYPSAYTQRDIDKVDGLKKPLDLFSLFIGLSVKIRQVANQINIIRMAKYYAIRYLRIIILEEIHEKYKGKIQEMLIKTKECRDFLKHKLDGMKHDYKEPLKKLQTLKVGDEVAGESNYLDIKKMLIEETMSNISITTIERGSEAI